MKKILDYDPLTLPDLPMPGQSLTLDRQTGKEAMTVIASCHSEMEDYPDEWTILLLAPKAPFYVLAHFFVAFGETSVSVETWEYDNIVPATAAYRDMSDCW